MRSATATGRVLLGPEVFALVASNQLKKGDVLTVAQLAGRAGSLGGVDGGGCGCVRCSLCF